MNKNNLRLAAFALVAISLSASPAFAIVIDDFEGTDSSTLVDGLQAGTTNPNSYTDDTGNASGNDFGSPSTILGGNRDISVERLSGSSSVMASIAGGLFQFAEGPNNSGTATLTYNGINGSPEDFSGELSFDIQVNSTGNTPPPTLIQIQVTLTDSSNQSAMESVFVDGPGIFPILLSAFTGANNLLDLVNISQIDVTILGTSANGEDISIDQITTTPLQTVVPEPSSVAIWGALTALGFVAARRRRKQSAEQAS